MEPKESFDEVQFQTLWADGLDPLTAAAASYSPQESEPQPAGIEDSEPAVPLNARYYSDCGLAFGMAAVIVWWLFF
jgi:hypothetical protein